MEFDLEQASRTWDRARRRDRFMTFATMVVGVIVTGGIVVAMLNSQARPAGSLAGVVEAVSGRVDQIEHQVADTSKNALTRRDLVPVKTELTADVTKTVLEKVGTGGDAELKGAVNELKSQVDGMKGWGSDLAVVQRGIGALEQRVSGSDTSIQAIDAKVNTMTVRLQAVYRKLDMRWPDVELESQSLSNRLDAAETALEVIEARLQQADR